VSACTCSRSLGARRREPAPASATTTWRADREEERTTRNPSSTIRASACSRSPMKRRDVALVDRGFVARRARHQRRQRVHDVVIAPACEPADAVDRIAAGAHHDHGDFAVPARPGSPSRRRLQTSKPQPSRLGASSGSSALLLVMSPLGSCGRRRSPAAPGISWERPSLLSRHGEGKRLQPDDLSVPNEVSAYA
jgi:hypothetical protein